MPIIPLTAYVDLGTAYGTKKLLYGTGLSVSLLRKYVQVYLPVAGSNYPQGLPESFDQFRDNIRFQLQLNTLNPFRQLTNALRL